MITISVMGVLFVMSAVLNLNVLSNLMAARRTVGLSRLNTLLLQLVIADLLVRVCESRNRYSPKTPNFLEGQKNQ